MSQLPYNAVANIFTRFGAAKSRQPTLISNTTSCFSGWFWLTLALTLSSCGQLPVGDRIDKAQQIASRTGFTQRIFEAADFPIISYQKVTRTNTLLRIYLEGDGHAWATRYRPSTNPTPIRPVALELAALDAHSEVAYLARPCQFILDLNSTACQAQHWTHERYSGEILASVNTALDAIKAQGQWQEIELVGFSGGGTLALLLAATRSDIRSVRTIAGNLSPLKFSHYHQVSPLTGSLEPSDYAYRLRHIPQRHFIGENDKVITRPISDDYQSRLGNSHCSSLVIVADTSHTDGWSERWRQLLDQSVSCHPE